MANVVKRDYVDGPFGQVHVRLWGGDTLAKPVFCLPPAPFSSVAYASLAPLIAQHRKVVAIDYPGYGNSDATVEQPSIRDFAEAVLAVVKRYSEGESVNLLGFHTGCLVAVEAALVEAQAINQLLLIDVPYFQSEKRAEFLAQTEAVMPLDADAQMLQKPWDFCVTKKLEHMSIERAFQMFVDHISSGSRGNSAFRAAFSYPCEERLAALTHKTTVIATDSMLYAASVRAAEHIKSASLVELLEIKAAVLEEGACSVSRQVQEVLA